MSKKNNKKGTAAKPLPYDLIQGTFGKRYVFFDTLRTDPSSEYHDVYTYASDLITNLKKTLSPPQEESGTNRLTEALNFLKNSAEYERTKELRFFRNFESRFPEIKELFQIDVQDIKSDYTQFIININRALKGTKEFKAILSSEQKRIIDMNNTNKDYYNKMKKVSGPEYKQYQKDLAAERRKNNERFFLTSEGTSMFNSIFSEKNKGLHEISMLIIEKFKEKIFKWEKNGLTLDARQLVTLQALINIKANEIFLSQFRSKNPTITLIEASNSIVNNPEMTKFIDDLLNSPNLDTALTSMANQYGLSKKNQEKLEKNTQLINKLKKRLKNQYDELVKEGKINAKTLNYNQWLESIGITDQKLNAMYNSIQPISSQSYYVSEDINLTNFIINHISAVLGGGLNPTDDIEAGTLITNLILDQSKLNQLESQLWKSQETHFKKVKATSTLQSFIDNTSELLAAREEQQNLLKEFLKENKNGELAAEELLKHINIHSTVKAYESAGSYAFEKYGGFGGAAFGATLSDELGILSSVGNAAGLPFTEQDKEDFFLAMINAGNHMIGKELKHCVENYFSTFIGLLMFNDAQIAAMDIKNWMNDNKINNLVEDLHVYELNGVIIPSSYLLEETYKALAPIANDIQQKSNRGIHVTLNTYNGGPINHDWELTAATAISVTKLERMHFLAGFKDLIDELNKKMQNIG